MGRWGGAELGWHGVLLPESLRSLSPGGGGITWLVGRMKPDKVHDQAGSRPPWPWLLADCWPTSIFLGRRAAQRWRCLGLAAAGGDTKGSPGRCLNPPLLPGAHRQPMRGGRPAAGGGGG